jgi:AraC family transcriptional regulator of adaptative response/methylated-DNA-[protein]-cysteine methyltransferase
MNLVRELSVKPLAQASLDYQRIEKAILYLQTHYLEQPDLASVSRAVHMSEYHFQRVFSRWAGISPKRFLQFLTIEHAKQHLTESRDVLEVALSSGLSSPGRLHDLFVSVEAVSPGEFKTRGAGIRIEYGFHATPFGRCLIGLTRRGICWMSFTVEASESEARREMELHWSGAECERNQESTRAAIGQIFSKVQRPEPRSLSVLLMGTNFQLKVWRALLNVPAGAVVSYGALGEMVGRRRGARAVGSAVARNPIAYLIPCHRVIRSTGVLGDYRWGEVRKRALLGWERARSAA